MKGEVSKMEIGDVFVAITDNANHSPATWADLATRRIIEIADTTPEPLKSQAKQFRDHLHSIIAYYVGEALRVERERAWVERESR